MSIASATAKSGPYAGNGVTVAFAVGFACQAATDLVVVRTDASDVDTTLTYVTDYSVVLNADQVASPGGTVTLAVAPAVGLKVTILRNVALTQGTQLPNQGAWYPKVVENALDKLTMIVQQLSEKVGRAVVAGVTVDPAALLASIYSAVTTSGTNASTATTQAGIATTQAGIATTEAGNASTSAASAAASAASIALPSIGGNALRALRANAGATALEYFDVLKLTRSPRTANVVLGIADNQKFIDITSGTFTQTFTAAATLGSGWYCWIKNSGTGDITLDPNAAELIDGLASYIMYPGEARLVQCDGVTLTSTVISPFNKTFISSANFIKPPGYTDFGGGIWNGGRGGNGGRGFNTTNGFAGDGGSGAEGGEAGWFFISAAKLSASSVVTIGAGGTGGTNATTDNTFGGSGGAGGATSFGPISFADGDFGPWFAKKSGGAGAFTTPAVAGTAAKAGGAGGGGGAGGNQGNSPAVGGASIVGGNGGNGGALRSNGITGAVRGGGGGGGGGSDVSGLASGPGGAGGRGEVCVWGIA